MLLGVNKDSWCRRLNYPCDTEDKPKDEVLEGQLKAYDDSFDPRLSEFVWYEHDQVSDEKIIGENCELTPMMKELIWFDEDNKTQDIDGVLQNIFGLGHLLK